MVAFIAALQYRRDTHAYSDKDYVEGQEMDNIHNKRAPGITYDCCFRLKRDTDRRL